MPRFAVPVAVIGIVTSGLSIAGALMGATVLGVNAVYLLYAFAFAFMSAAVAYYSTTMA